MADRNQPYRLIDAPQPGYFRLRLIKGAPLVPAAIYRAPNADPQTGEPMTERYWPLWAQIATEAASNEEDAIMRVWTSGEVIDHAIWSYLMNRIAWAASNSPSDPLLRPRERVDLNTVAPPTFRILP